MRFLLAPGLRSRLARNPAFLIQAMSSGSVGMGMVGTLLPVLAKDMSASGSRLGLAFSAVAAIALAVVLLWLPERRSRSTDEEEPRMALGPYAFIAIDRSARI